MKLYRFKNGVIVNLNNINTVEPDFGAKSANVFFTNGDSVKVPYSKDDDDNLMEYNNYFIN